MYTYIFCKKLSNVLGITFIEVPELSDQILSIKPIHNLDSVPAPMSLEVREAISRSRMGQSPPNKGISNPKQSERFKLNNPMFNLESKEKMRQSKIGKVPHNKITKIVEYSCKWCGKIHTRLDNYKSKRSFCNKSCAASYSNTHRYRCD